MATLVKQTSVNPTRKLTAATIATAAMSVGGLIIKNLLPEWYDPTVWTQLTPVIVFLAGYFTHDEAVLEITSIPEEQAAE